MQRQLLFKSDGVTSTGVLPGAYVFPEAGQLVRALCSVNPPSAGTIEIALEVDGEFALDDAGARLVFVLTASGQDYFTVARTLNVNLAAGAVVRWRVTGFTAPVEDGPVPVSISVSYVSGDYATAFVPAAELTVRWVQGAERLSLFDYDPSTRTFSETLEGRGLSAARAAIETNSGRVARLSLEGVTALLVNSGVLRVAAVEALGGVATSDEPRLEFLVGGTRIATLAKSGVLRVAQLAEETPEPADTAFTFLTSSGVTAVLARNQLQVTAISML